MEASTGETAQGKQSKRLRSENGASQSSVEASVESLQRFNGHTDAATCVSWPTEDKIISGAMDFTVRSWLSYALALVSLLALKTSFAAWRDAAMLFSTEATHPWHPCCAQ